MVDGFSIELWAQDDVMYTIMDLQLTNYADYSDQNKSPFLVVHSLLHTIYRLQITNNHNYIPRRDYEKWIRENFLV